MFELAGIQAKIVEYLIVIVLVFSALFGAYHKGSTDAIKDIEVKQALVDKAQQAKYDLVASQYEALKVKRREDAKVITKEVTKIIERPVYSNKCLDDDGRMLINNALQGTTPSSINATLSATTKP